MTPDSHKSKQSRGRTGEKGGGIQGMFSRDGNVANKSSPVTRPTFLFSPPSLFTYSGTWEIKTPQKPLTQSIYSRSFISEP